MKWFDWKHERTTVVWPIKVGDWEQAAGVIRVHYDKDKVPGDYHCAGTIIVKDRQYEVMGFITKDREAGTVQEFKEFYGYLASLGLKRKHHIRAKGGEVHTVKDD
jgi:hypothetical protein